MKIVKLQAENIKRLVAVEISPDGNMVEITGANGQGKTSVLDSIWWALAGTRGIQAQPIRNGEDHARIRLDLGELVVTRTFRRANETEFTTSIAVESADGARFASPQTMIDGMLGQLAFDPLEFARAEPKRQVEALRRFVPGFDFAASEAAAAGEYARRTEVNRRAKEARARAASILVPAGVAAAEPADEDAIIARISSASTANAAAADERMRRQRHADERSTLAAKIEAAKARLALMDVEQAAWPAAPETVDLAELQRELADARTRNAHCRAFSDRAKALDDARALEDEALRLTASMDRREADRLAAIASAKLPIPGLGFGDGCVTLGGIPFDQMSDAEQLRVSVAIAIASKGSLSVVRIRDGSLLDERSLRMVAEMADASDCQVWIERVDSSGKVGFVIEDGVARDTGEHAGKHQEAAKTAGKAKKR